MPHKEARYRTTRAGRHRKNAFRQCPLANADTLQSSACHCEERSDVAIRSPCGSTWQRVVPKANPQLVRIRPSSCQLVRYPCGDADCRTSSPQSPPCRRPKVRHAQLRPKARAGQRSLGSPFPTKRAALRGPVVMPAKGRSWATLPWGSPPRKRYPFAGAPALVRNDMLKVVTRLRLQGGLARGVRKNLPRGCKGKGQFSSPGCKKSTGAKQALLRRWQGMRDSNPRKRSQSPVCYRYTNPLF